jgi:hypothetical protein
MDVVRRDRPTQLLTEAVQRREGVTWESCPRKVNNVGSFERRFRVGGQFHDARPSDKNFISGAVNRRRILPRLDAKTEISEALCAFRAAKNGNSKNEPLTRSSKGGM